MIDPTPNSPIEQGVQTWVGNSWTDLGEPVSSRFYYGITDPCHVSLIVPRELDLRLPRIELAYAAAGFRVDRRQTAGYMVESRALPHYLTIWLTPRHGGERVIRLELEQLSDFLARTRELVPMDFDRASRQKPGVGLGD